MKENDPPELAYVRLVAQGASLPLADEDAVRLAGAVGRIKGMAAVVRRLVRPELEPRPIFVAKPRTPGG